MAELISTYPTANTIFPYGEVVYSDPYEDEKNPHPADFITGLIEYLNAIGYSVSEECACQFFLIGGSQDLDTTERFLKPLVVKNEAQANAFHKDFQDYIHRHHAIVVDPKTERRLKLSISTHNALESRLESCSSSIKRNEKEAEKLRKEIEERAKKQGGDPKLENAYKKVEKSYKSVSAKIKDTALREKVRKHATGAYQPMAQSEHDQMKAALSEMLKNAIICPDFKKLMAFIKSQASRLTKDYEANRVSAESRLKDHEAALAKAKKEQEEIQRKLDEAAKSIKEELTLVRKAGTLAHRESFEKAHNAVQSKGAGELSGVLDQNFNRLTVQQKEQIKDYIRENARQFKTRLLRSINTANKEKLDLSETCRRACETGGIPLRLYFKRKTKSQAKVILFLDISGSCKEVSELMLFFLYTMKEVFPGGCKPYVFINSLYDVSEYMEARDADEAISSIMQAVPRAGVYSDYYTPFRDFYEHHMSEINNETLVFFIGDARNNKNDTGEEFVKAVSRKCKRAYWMNADPHRKWNQGDSIISVYAPYMRMVGEVLTPNQLIEYLMKI